MAIASIGMIGCAKNFMQRVSPDFTVAQAAPDAAQIIFLRATRDANSFSAPILEVTDSGSLQFISIIPRMVKFLHKTTPGKHLYLIDSKSGFFMEAELEAGKTYYAYITPHLEDGVPKHIQFTPVTAEAINSKKFTDDLARCGWRVNAPRGEQWFSDNKIRLEKRYSKSIQSYSTIRDKTPKMLPEYGIVVPAR